MFQYLEYVSCFSFTTTVQPCSVVQSAARLSLCWLGLDVVRSQFWEGQS